MAHWSQRIKLERLEECTNVLLSRLQLVYASSGVTKKPDDIWDEAESRCRNYTKCGECDWNGRE